VGYQNIYRRCGIGSRTLLTYASGGIFSRYSHEFQTVTPYGEDIIYRIPESEIAINKEIIGDESVLAELMPDYKTGDEARLEELKAIEVGDIFKLGSRFTDAFSAQYTDRAGMQQKIVMGCYGLGPSRLMGAIAECLADEKGLVWPKEIAPYHLHLVSLVRDSAEIEQCDQIYHRLVAQGIDVLYNDRQESQAGKKLADADLIGIADRIVVSRKMLAAGGVEWKARLSNQSAVITLEKLCEILQPTDRARIN
jgi:prolyl-tRNA synthetase